MGNSIFKKNSTARGVAKQRFIESLAKPEKRIIYDPNAQPFVRRAKIIKFIGFKLSVWITKKFVPGFHEHIISRTKFIDDLVQSSAIKGAEQYVILGAGYDLRAHRLNLPPKMKIYEVDQKEMQDIKRSELHSNVLNLENVKYVSVDFNHESLKKQLLNAGFDQSKSTVFTLEGVSQYISKPAMNSILKEVASLTKNSDTTFYMSYVNIALKTDIKTCFGIGYPNPEKKTKTVMRFASKVGEPWISFYSAKEIEEMLSSCGFEIKANKTLKDFNLAYFFPVGRGLSENEILNLEHSITAEREN